MSRGIESKTTLSPLYRAVGTGRFDGRPAGAALDPQVCPSLPIDSIGIYAGRVPVKCRFSYGSVNHFEFTILTIRSGKMTGWGETLHVLNDAFIASLRQLIGQNARNLDEVIRPAASDATIEDYRLEAVSIALHDLAARQLNIPLHKLLGRQARRAVPVSPCVFPLSPDSAAATAKAFAQAGSRQIKIKLLADPQFDLTTVRLVREAIGPHLLLHGDANLGYPLELLQNGHLAKLKAEGLDILEDPGDVDAMTLAALRSSEHPQIMIDCAVRTRAGVTQVLQHGAADVVNLHPCQQGTLSEAIARHTLCAQSNIPVYIGGTGFLGIGTAAYLQLASVIGTEYPCGEVGGSVDHGMPRIWDGYEMIDGQILLPDEPGIGFTPTIAPLEPYLYERIFLG